MKKPARTARTRTRTTAAMVVSVLCSIWMSPILRQQHRTCVQAFSKIALSTSRPFRTTLPSSATQHLAVAAMEPTSTTTTTTTTTPTATTKNVNAMDIAKHKPITTTTTTTTAPLQPPLPLVNLHTIPKNELEQIIQSWGYPKYRAGQIHNWVRETGVTSIDDMKNLPKDLLATLHQFASLGSLQLDEEMISKDGTIKRAYRLFDGQLIESVLMPYEDGRCTACISSQAGCAMGCVFCATGQMGFARQLTPDEIFEQVSRFSSELKQQNKRLSNIVFMGMGEPLANYRNVKSAIQRITGELNIGARKITVSTVGVVPNIRKLISDPDLPQIRLAVSLHCASEEERNALMPANARYGGLGELMMALKEYIDTTGRRITLEWALIEGQNDTPETANKLGQLIRRYKLRTDMVHINVIPLNPTGGFAGSPSGRTSVNDFCKIMEQQFSVSCTPRVRRGIDIDAGCGQLKSKIVKKEQELQKQTEEETAQSSISNDDRDLKSFMTHENANVAVPMLGVYNDDDGDDDYDDKNIQRDKGGDPLANIYEGVVDFSVDDQSVDIEEDDWEDPEFETDVELQEASRLMELVTQTLPGAVQVHAKAPPVKTDPVLDEEIEYESPIKGPTTCITDEEAVIKARKRRKKILRNLKQIGKLQVAQKEGKELNEEQSVKVSRKEEWRGELESLEHNLQ